MISRNENLESVGSLPFSSMDVGLSPHFDKIDIFNISDTFSLMAEALEQAEAAVCALGETAYTTTERGGATTPEKLVMSRYTLAHDGALILPLLETHLAALKMTARAMVEGLRDVANAEIVSKGERV